MVDALGKLRERIIIQRKVDAVDALRGRTPTWSTLDTVAAELVPWNTPTAAERIQGTAVQSSFEAQFRIRARADVTAKMRVIWTPRFPSGAPRRVLEIVGDPMPDPADPLTFQILSCTRSATL